MPTWTERTIRYLDQLAQLVDRIENQLQQTRISATGDGPQAVSSTASQLQQALGELEQTVADRHDLLIADDAPQVGDTLAKKLMSLAEAGLADQCERLGSRIADVHQQSVSVFVCQYHLADLTTDLVRLMTGASRPATYDRVENRPLTTPGGLFNESA